MLPVRRRQWQPTPVFLPGKSHGRRSLVGCSPWVAKSWARLSGFTFSFHFHALEKEMATHSSILAWRIPGTEEPSGLPSMGLHRVRHDWSDLAAAAAAAACFQLCLCTHTLYTCKEIDFFLKHRWDHTLYNFKQLAFFVFYPFKWSVQFSGYS